MGGVSGGAILGAGGAAATGPTLMDPYQLDSVGDGCRHRPEGVLASRVMVWVDPGSAPVRDIAGLAVPRHQGSTLLILEYRQGLPSGGAVSPRTGCLKTPALGFGSQLGRIVEIDALEEALPDVLNAPFDLGLVLGMADPRRVGDEAAVLGVLWEALGEDRMQDIRSRHCRRAVVDHQVAGDAAEEGPGRLQPVGEVLQLLAKGGPDKAVLGVAQHSD